MKKVSLKPKRAKNTHTLNYMGDGTASTAAMCALSVKRQKVLYHGLG